MWRRKLPTQHPADEDEATRFASPEEKADTGRADGQGGPARRALGAVLRTLSRWASRARAMLRRLLVRRHKGSEAQPSPATWTQARPAGRSAVAERELLKLVMELATGLWRIGKATPPPNDDGSTDELRRLRRHIEAAWDVLADAGVEVQEHTGERYVTGMAVKVLAFQPVTGVNTELIEETIRPSVFYKERLVSPGEVIVATPETGATQNEGAETQAQPPAEPDDPDCVERDDTTEQ